MTKKCHQNYCMENAEFKVQVSQNTPVYYCKNHTEEIKAVARMLTSIKTYPL